MKVHLLMSQAPNHPAEFQEVNFPAQIERTDRSVPSTPKVTTSTIEDTTHKLNSFGQVGGFVEDKVMEWVSWWNSTPAPMLNNTMVESINQVGETK